jgi:eukaryotic-like serine/threonine-protein kinase
MRYPDGAGHDRTRPERRPSIILTTSMALAPGTRLGPYEILSALGAGGMGEVWKARDTRLNRLVAIKASHSRFSERFEREARAIAAVNHPHVCSLYDVGPTTSS